MSLEEQLIAVPRLATYVQGWGRDGDVAFAATNGAATMGVAWYRLFQTDSPGYGFIDDATPELGIAVWQEFRRQGVGTLLMRTILRHAAGRFRHLSLSVSDHNHAAKSLYAAAGFEEHSREGLAIKMISPSLSLDS